MAVSTLDVIVTAFVAQLAVLPGEKVQFIIAGLSTRYNPLTVVAAAASAFAGWTVLEIAFGEVLVQTLPGVVLDLVTVGLFVVFALLLVRTAPAPGENLVDRATVPADDAEDDGGPAATQLAVSIRGRRVPQPFGGFLPIFAMMAAGEFGDKTQMITIVLASQFGAHPGIWIGEMLAIIPVSLANAYIFHRFANRVNLRLGHFVGAGIFVFFAADTLLSLVVGVSVWDAVVAGLSDLLLGLV